MFSAPCLTLGFAAVTLSVFDNAHTEEGEKSDGKGKRRRTKVHIKHMKRVIAGLLKL